MDRVQEGIRHFAAGDFDAASRSFSEADVADPDNPAIVYDRACALAAASDPDKAKELFQEASLGRDLNLAARAHYNLGCLVAASGRAALGTDPVAAPPQQRQPAIDALLTAVGHYRDCLRLEDDHGDARHNLELIRLFIKNIQARWKEQDQQKERKEMGLLEFLQRVEQRQSELRSVVRDLQPEPDSPRRRETTREAGGAQAELADEIEPLKGKITQHIQPVRQAQTMQSGTDPDAKHSSRAEQAEELLHQLADETGDLMLKASSTIEAGEFSDSHFMQREVLNRLNQIFMAAAPFLNVLQKAVPQQEKLTAATEAHLGTGEVDDEQTTVLGGPPADIDFEEQSWRQSHVTDWSRMLSLKAQAELPAVESQLPALQNQPDAKTIPPEDEPNTLTANPNAAIPAEQLEAMKESLQKAIELGPQLEEHSQTAADRLTEQDSAAALPEQQRALELLREIAQSLQQQQQDNQQIQDGKQENENSQQQQQQQQQPSPEQSPQEQAMSVLRRVRERERRHREMQKQLQHIIGGRIPVNRDW